MENYELQNLLSDNDEECNSSTAYHHNNTKMKYNSQLKLFITKLKGNFPAFVFFILGNEFCERYCYYGMRTILVLYLKYYLHWDDVTATSVYHAFTVFAYFFPLVGAVVADSWWGKYNTILWLSFVYAMGMVLITLGAIADLGDLTVHSTLSIVGLAVIAFGTGGIKPCVTAFGGDQFDTNQDEYRRSFFSLFYFAINAGSLLSTFFSPLIREHIQCFGGDCYALAFGIPAVLMIIAIALFIIGTKFYTRHPPVGNIFHKVCAIVMCAIKNRWNTPLKQRIKDSWLDYAYDGTNRTIIRDIKYVINVLIIFTPLPLFWALFDQQGSRWTLQAVRMNGYVGYFHILPDQMQLCNPLLIIILIPLFEVSLYPCLRKFNINFSPLRRMAAGMMLACLSFIVAAWVQMMIDKNLTLVPHSEEQASFRVINSANCDLVITTDMFIADDVDADAYKNITEYLLSSGEVTDTKERFVTPGKYNISYGCFSHTPHTYTAVLSGLHSYQLIVSNAKRDTLKHLFTTYRTTKSSSGDALVTIVNSLNVKAFVNGIAILPNTKYDFEGQGRGAHDLYIDVFGFKYKRRYNVQTGGLYTLIMRKNGTFNGIIKDSDLYVDDYMDVHYNDVSILWLIPQYFIITLGEVFLSVTGLEFAYSQAPPSMKSVLTSFWLLSVSLGNIIVLVVAEARFVQSQANEYFLFSGLIGVAAILFIRLSMRYKYVDESKFREDNGNETSLTKRGLERTNEDFDASNTVL